MGRFHIDKTSKGHSNRPERTAFNEYRLNSIENAWIRTEWVDKNDSLSASEVRTTDCPAGSVGVIHDCTVNLPSSCLGGDQAADR